MRVIHLAPDAQMRQPHPRPLIPSPRAFDGSFDRLLDEFIVPNLPDPQAVIEFHEQLVEYVGQPDPLLLVRKVRGMDRGQAYQSRHGVRFKASDNAPAWWVHATLFQGYRIAPGAFGGVVSTMPTHMFEISQTSPPTANSAGWHIAHIFDVGDRQTDFATWTRSDVVGRFVRSVHPCNYFLLPHPDWQRWGADQRVIGACAQLYARRYAPIWDDFIRLSGASVSGLSRVTGSIVYSYGERSSPPSLPHRTGAVSLPGPGVEYKASRLMFKRDAIEPLSATDVIRIVTPVGTFELTKAQFHEAFPRVIRSVSYREHGVYHYPAVPRAAEAFRIAPADETT